MYLSWEKEKDSKLPFILKLFEEEVLEKLDYDYIKSLKEKFLSYHDEDIIPKEIKLFLFSYCKDNATLAPDRPLY